LEVEYLEMQFEVRSGSSEVFGPHNHQGFGGNMFSEEHLEEHLPKVARLFRDYYELNHPGA
ncbi:hypothetical protein OY671_010039, partial [Metschnikowia pulcherrima]